MAKHTCEWCGKPHAGAGQLCRECGKMERKYLKMVAQAHRSSSTAQLLELRNLLFDMKFNMPNPKALPEDLDYQYDRISRYLSER